MINECRVLYKCEKGIMTFDMKKTVFLHRNCKEEVKEGLGVIEQGSMIDKGNYAFALFHNVATSMPKEYGTLDFFNNRGVPERIYKGKYGDNVFIKEEYTDLSFIRAYAADDGRQVFYECSVIKKDKYVGPNMYYKRIEDLIGEWEDITEEVECKIYADFHKKTGKLSLDNETVYAALRGLTRYKIVRIKISGVLVAAGKHEDLVIWGTDEEVKMTWLGRKMDLSNIECEEITF